MIIRVRTHAGIWRVNDVTPEMTIAELRQRLSTEHNANLSDDARQPLTLKPNPKGDQDTLSLGSTMQSLGLGHGDMVHLKLDESIRDMAHEVHSGGGALCRYYSSQLPWWLPKFVLESYIVVQEERIIRILPLVAMWLDNARFQPSKTGCCCLVVAFLSKTIVRSRPVIRGKASTRKARP